MTPPPSSFMAAGSNGRKGGGFTITSLVIIPIMAAWVFLFITMDADFETYIREKWIPHDYYHDKVRVEVVNVF